MRDRTRIIALGALGLLVAAGVSGCSSEQEELERWVAQVKKRPGGRIEPLPEIKPYESFAYNASDQRSPFSMSRPAGPGDGVRPDSKRNREFLEQFSLDTLAMVGTLKLGGRAFGLVQTKDGLVHRVLPGQYMGQNDGKIVSVSDSKISLVEIVPDGMGGYMERTAAIGLTD
ncbi:MAG TPA: pilus assembly protein PilP [Steroidobacteraceae bacterium]